MKIIIAYDSSKGNSFRYSIKIFIRQNSISAEVNKYVLYYFKDSSGMPVSDPKNIAAIIPSGQDPVMYSLQNIPATETKIFLAATCITRSGIESGLSKYIYLERKQNSWKIINQQSK